MIRPSFFAAALCILVTGCASLTTSPLPARPVDNSFVWDGATWRDGGGIYISVAAFEEQGKVAVCGLRSEQAPARGPGLDLNARMLISLRVELAGETVFSDLTAFPKTTWNEDAAPAGRASCFLTDLPWEPRFNGQRPNVVGAKRKFIYYE